MTKYTIQVENLGKEYIIGGAEQRHDSFREMLTGALKSPLRKLRKLGGSASEEERFWALKDVSFNVEQGEVLGIIGRNGAGKSTLLKVLSRITSPTEGRVVTRGRVASLLEVGTGFHPELTGRENIFLNGAILGMSRAEIDKQFDGIVEFAEIEKFLDTPVKRYSSGMYVRLAFAVAAHLDVDILVVDEVLAVGDQTFQKKCLGKMTDIAAGGRTVLFVSHNMAAIRRLCKRVVLLRHGLLAEDGHFESVIDSYVSESSGAGGSPISIALKGPLTDRITFDDIHFSKPRFTAADKIDITICGACSTDMEDLEVIVGLDFEGVRICSLHDSEPNTPIRKGCFKALFSVAPEQLRPGRYVLSVGAFRQINSDWCWAPQVALLEIENTGLEFGREQGVVNVSYASERLHC